MNEALNAVMQNLYPRGLLTPCPATHHGTMFHYRFLFKGRLIDEEVDVVPALNKKALREIVLGAINGSLPDMTVVATMYSAGFALPQDFAKAEAWAAFAVLQPAPSITYQEAVNLLKRDYKDANDRARDDLVWPAALEALIADTLAKLNTPRPYVDQPIEKGCFVTARLAGIRVNLIYRAYKKDGQFGAHLYGAFLHIGGTIMYSLDQLRLLDVPMELGMLRNRQTIPNYTIFGETVKLYIVTGTLVFPQSQNELRAANFPDVRTVGDMLKLYLDSLSRERMQSFDFVVVEQREKLQAAEKKLAEFERKAKTRKQYAEDVTKWRKRVKRLQAKVDDTAPLIDAARQEYVNKQPETYLRFVAQDIFSYQNGRLLAPQLRQVTARHLQALGFRSLCHPLVDLLGYEIKDKQLSGLDNVIVKFEQAYKNEYRIVGLNIRPCAETVNIKRCYTYTAN